MYQFFITEANILPDGIRIGDSGEVNHIKNVLRMKTGEEVQLCCPNLEREYRCRIREFTEDAVSFDIVDIDGMSRELPVKITLFQGLPKGDKMELIIQKAVELGACEIVPVMTKRSVVKLDVKKAAKKVTRWQAIADAAAKQSKRSILPKIEDVMTWEQAISHGADLDMLIIPYEDAKGIDHSRRILDSVAGKKSLGIYIGPEGGFDEREVEQAKKAGAQPVTLGHRILRTETAGMAVLSILMFQLEKDS